MSLLFTDGAGTRVSLGTGATNLENLTTFTYLLWIYRTATPGANRQLFETRPSGADGHRRLSLQSDNGLRGFVDRATTNANAISSTLTDLNTWNFVGMTYEEGVSTEIKLYKGSISATVAECAYSSGPTAGSGSSSGDNGQEKLIGNAGAGYAGAPPARIGWIGIWNTVLTLGQIKSQQFRMRKTAGCQLFMYLGYAPAASVQDDYSGNKYDGTVTAATLAPRLPAVTFPFGDQIPVQVSVTAADFYATVLTACNPQSFP